MSAARWKKWPLGINKEMDEHAARAGLAHWSCTHTNGNDWWIRRDGYPYACSWNLQGGYPAELRRIDGLEPMGDWVFGAKPKGELSNDQS